jgi:RNA polymerase sigma-70 factor (sigma-E family)
MIARARQPSRRSSAALLGTGATEAAASPPVPESGDDPHAETAAGGHDGASGGGHEGDAVASRLFHERYPTLVQMARLLVDDTETAEEVVQEAFVRLYGSWRRLRDPARVDAYLRSTVWNLARDRLRRRRTVRRYEAVTARGPDAMLGSTAPLGPADALIDRERREQLAAALDRLPARQRECVLLRYWGDLSEREIAATLGISNGSVKSHVHRALSRLTDELRERREAP